MTTSNGNGHPPDLPNRHDEAPDRDPISGQFVPGKSGNPKGRPKKFDLRAVAEEGARRAGVDLPTALWEILQALIDKGKGGDTRAARLVFETLADLRPPSQTNVNIDARDGGTVSVTGPPQPEDLAGYLRELGWTGPAAPPPEANGNGNGSGAAS